MTTATSAHHRLSTDRSPGRVVQAELIKLRGTPSVWMLAALALTAVLLSVVFTTVLQEIQTVDDARSLLSYSGTGGIIVILLGLVVSAGAYRHRTIVPTTLADPGRARSFWGQIVALGLVGLLVGLLASALTTAVVLAGVSILSDVPTPTAGDVAAAVAGGTLYTTIAAVLGGAIGALARNQVAAAIAMFVYLTMVDPLVGMAIPGFGQFGPIALGIAMGGASPDVTGGPGAQLLAPVVAGTVWFGYAAVLSVAALVSTLRRELP